MQQYKQPNRIILGLLAFGLLAGAALTAGPAQAVEALGPYYAEPAWDQKLPAATRFVVLTNWGSAAVLDKETGLVWEHSPSAATSTWYAARLACTDKTTGTRKGWRLPSVHELASLLHPSVAPPGPTLPPGHPFLTVESVGYWSATTNAVNPTNAWIVFFGNGSVSGFSTSFPGRSWCVRGGMHADQY